MSSIFVGSVKINIAAISWNNPVLGKLHDRILRKEGMKARLSFTGSGLAIPSFRAARRAKGIGITIGEKVSKDIVKSFVAAGVPVEEARNLEWKSVW